MSTQNEQIGQVSGTEQGKLRQPPRPGGKLKSERVQEELKTMPGWKPLSQYKALSRTRHFRQPQAAARFAAFAFELAAMESQALTLGITGSRVTLTVERRNRNGINMPLIEFARQLG
jgi:pterin-4a-carbinolamine dehydratase